jgi:hypothetical protein
MAKGKRYKTRKNSKRIKKINKKIKKMVGGYNIYTATILIDQQSVDSSDAPLNEYKKNENVIVEKNDEQIITRSNIEDVRIKVFNKDEWLTLKQIDTDNGNVTDYLKLERGILEPNIVSAKILKSTNSFNDDLTIKIKEYWVGSIVKIDTDTKKDFSDPATSTLKEIVQSEDKKEWFIMSELKIIDDPEDFIIELDVYPYDHTDDGKNNKNHNGYKIGDVKLKTINGNAALTDFDKINTYLKQIFGTAQEYNDLNEQWQPKNQEKIKELFKSTKTRFVFKPTPFTGGKQKTTKKRYYKRI